MKNLIKYGLSSLLVASILLSMNACNKTKDIQTESESDSSTESTVQSSEDSDYDYLNPYSKYDSMDLSQYMTLCDYKGIEIEEYDPTPTDEQIEEELNQFLSQFKALKEITDRGAQEGDTIVFDYSGVLDDQTIDVSASSFAATDNSHVLGSGGFIDGFEEGLTGMTVGEVKDIHIYFPENYSVNTALSGQGITFTLTMKSISEYIYPELTDKLVAENTDFYTLDEYKASLYESLTEENEEIAIEEQKNDVWDYLVENSNFVGFPETVYSEYYNEYISYYTDYATYYGYSDLESFMTNYFGMTLDEFYDYSNTYAESLCSEEMLVYAISKAENIVMTEDDFNTRGAELAEYYEYEDLDSFVSYYGKDVIAKTILFDIVMDSVMSYCVVK